MNHVLKLILGDWKDFNLTMGDFLEAIQETHGPRTAYVIYEFAGTGKERVQVRRALPFFKVIEDSRRLAETLIASGVRPGDRVALLRESGPEWVISLFAILLSRAVVVPIDIKLGIKEISDIFSNSGAKAVLTSNFLENVAERARENFPEILPIVFEGYTSPPVSTQRAKARLPGLHFNDLAMIVFTSGSTSNPKGVMIRLNSLIFEVNALLKMVPTTGPQSSFLSILPPNHLFELCCGILGPFTAGSQVTFSTSLMPEDILAQMRAEKVTDIICVPLFLKMMRKGMLAQVERKPASRAWYSGASRMANSSPFRPVRRALFAPIHRKMGGHLARFICGGASLEKHVAEFFEQMGISTLQGYGMTEMAPVICTNTDTNNRLGSVGKALPGVEVKVSPTGEILVRGPNRMMGYYNNPKLTAETIDAEGWLHTADLGYIDQEGYIFVTGRSKELIVLGNGKKVFPAEVEEILTELVDSQKVKELCVLGTGATSETANEEVCLVVVEPSLDEERLRSEVSKVCKPYAPYKRPTRIIIRREKLPVTTSHKVNRAALKKWVESQKEVVS